MKKAFCLIVSVVLFSMGLFAQEQTKKVNPEAVREKVLKKKLAYYTEHLKLTKEEYNKFSPLYSQYDKELFAIGSVSHEASRKLKGEKWQNVKSEEAEQLLQQLLESERQEMELKTAYVEKFKGILPAKKVAKLMMEERFIMRKIMNCEKHRNKECKLKAKDHNQPAKEAE